MALIDNFAPGLEEGRLSAHGFASMLNVAGNGVFGNAADARARIISAFNLQVSDEAQLDAIIDAYTALSDSGDRAKLLRDVEDSLLGFESGLITEAEAISNAGI